MNVNESGCCRECGCPEECGRNAADDRVEKLEAAIRKHRKSYGGECSTAEIMRRDARLYAVLEGKP